MKKILFFTFLLAISSNLFAQWDLVDSMMPYWNYQRHLLPLTDKLIAFDEQRAFCSDNIGENFSEIFEIIGSFMKNCW